MLALNFGAAQTFRLAGGSGNWGIHQSKVLLDTVQRFKGPESAVAILWGMDKVDSAANRKLVYVGMTRAKPTAGYSQN